MAVGIKSYSACLRCNLSSRSRFDEPRILAAIPAGRALKYVPYASLERVIEDNKDLYYKALRRTQTTLKGETPDWEPWVGFFLRCLKRQKDSLTARLDRQQIAQRSEADLPELSLQILKALRAKERLTIAQLASITAANRNTLKVRLRELVADRRVRQHGKARATWYSL